jgi:hypothetical protein
MVRPRTILYLAAAAALLILATLALNGSGPAFSGSTGGQLLFPGLKDRLDDVARISIATADRTLAVARNDKGWALASKDGYPAKFDMVKQTLVGLAEERAVEAKTAEPSLYSRLEVEDPKGKDARSALVTLEDAKGGVLASLILGKQHFARAGNGPDQLYVRKPGEARSWLAEGPLARNDGWKLWVDPGIVSLDRDSLAELDVTPADDKPYRLIHDKPGQSDFALQDIPPDQKVKDIPAVNALAAALGMLRLEDVMAAKQLKPEAKLLRKLEFRRFDGLTVDVAEYGQDGKDWFKFAAHYDEKTAMPPAPATPPAAGAPAAPTATAPAAAKPDEAKADQVKSEQAKADQVKKEAADIAARTQDWLYKLEPSDETLLNTKFSDLLEPKEPPKPKG